MAASRARVLLILPSPEGGRRMAQTRATRIVATVGPATMKPAVLRAMVKAGTDVFRFNMSHGSHAEHGEAIHAVRAAAARAGRPVGILVDLQGPKVRTGLNESGGRLYLRQGATLELSYAGSGRHAERSRAGRIVVGSRKLLRELKRGDQVLLDDGRMTLEVVDRPGDSLTARVARGGWLKERAGVNVPGPLEGFRAPTTKDRRDAEFAVRQGADFVALSFVQTAGDIRRVRRLLDRHVRRLGGDPPLLIAKLEKPAALNHLDEILDVAGGVMVARGDLGVELSLEKVPLWQKEILHRARARGIATITATEMLHSMVESASPTRAEVSDIANAILDGTDSLLVSAETAIGKHPVETIRILDRVAAEVDRAWQARDAEEVDREYSLATFAADPVRAVARAAVDLAVGAGARWIIVFTLSGRTVRYVTQHRPPMPVMALTPHEATRRRLTLSWNTHSLILKRSRNVDEMMRRGLELLRRRKLVRKGDMLVLAAGTADLPAATNLLRLVKVGSRG
ncbi:MAG: pyruvate kinase [Candidatus Eisenbacteria bacterium]|nr:pyruvate kinase [Candidatus Eisenbacteria bacterium]